MHISDDHTLLAQVKVLKFNLFKTCGFSIQCCIHCLIKSTAFAIFSSVRTTSSTETSTIQSGKQSSIHIGCYHHRIDNISVLEYLRHAIIDNLVEKSWFLTTKCGICVILMEFTNFLQPNPAHQAITDSKTRLQQSANVVAVDRVTRDKLPNTTYIIQYAVLLAAPVLLSLTFKVANELWMAAELLQLFCHATVGKTFQNCSNRLPNSRRNIQPNCAKTEWIFFKVSKRIKTPDSSDSAHFRLHEFSQWKSFDGCCAQQITAISLVISIERNWKRDESTKRFPFIPVEKCKTRLWFRSTLQFKGYFAYII